MSDNGPDILSSMVADVPSADIDRSVSRGLALSQLIHPSHEPIIANAVERRGLDDSSTARVHESLGISSTVYQNL